MKVVLFTGGKSLRLPGQSEEIPKPMISVGYRPILWHVMRYYSHWGYRDFLLCLGYKADAVKSYFLRYNEALSNDFVLTKGGRQVDLERAKLSRIKLACTVLPRVLSSGRATHDESHDCGREADHSGNLIPRSSPSPVGATQTAATDLRSSAITMSPISSVG